MRFFYRRVLALVAVFAAAPVDADLVKKTDSGICHPSSSSYYERIKSFRAFDSVESCLKTGGRLPKGLQVARLEPQADTGYSRSRFGHGWADEDGDCQNSRMEALAAQSTIAVRYADARKCRVVSGRWISPFTGNVLHNASEIDIDHVVPLKWAWDHGASEWPQEKRERFANDQVNLWSVELSLNRQKGAHGPDDWLPPSGRCQYITRFVRIAKIYGLLLDDSQSDGYKRQVAQYCQKKSATALQDN